MTSLSDYTPTIPEHAVVLAAKLAEARRGGCVLTPDDKAAIADEIGRMADAALADLWASIPTSSCDRDRLIGLVAAACTPDVTSRIVTGWLMAKAVEIAREQIEREDASRLRETRRALAEAERAEIEAINEAGLARNDRAEALALLAEARQIKADAEDRAEVARLRLQVNDLQTRLLAIHNALNN
jgi:hypothetical protein